MTSMVEASMVEGNQAIHDTTAAVAWRQLIDWMFSRKDEFVAVASGLGLTPMSGHALMALEPDCPQPMRALADNMGCDRSQVTGVVDRLEELGYARRESSKHDRRVKELVVTPAGVQAAQQLRSVLYAAPAALERLSAEQIDAFAAAIDAVVTDATAAV